MSRYAGLILTTVSLGLLVMVVFLSASNPVLSMDMTTTDQFYQVHEEHIDFTLSDISGEMYVPELNRTETFDEPIAEGVDGPFANLRIISTLAVILLGLLATMFMFAALLKNMPRAFLTMLAVIAALMILVIPLIATISIPDAFAEDEVFPWREHIAGSRHGDAWGEPGRDTWQLNTDEVIPDDIDQDHLYDTTWEMNRARGFWFLLGAGVLMLLAAVAQWIWNPPEERAMKGTYTHRRGIRTKAPPKGSDIF